MGGMKMKRAQNELLALLQNSKTPAEETVAVIEALVNIWDSPTRTEISRLAKSNRAGLRQLACQVIAHFDRKSDADLIIPLIDDHNADVRQAALWVLGYLRIEKINNQFLTDIVEKKLNDIDPLVAIKAAWVMTLNNQKKGQEAFKSWFRHPSHDVRLMAATHLAACGKYAFPLILEQFKNSNEPYIRMNLALGLLGQRVETQEACQALYDGLQNIKERWTWDEKNHVHALILQQIKIF